MQTFVDVVRMLEDDKTLDEIPMETVVRAYQEGAWQTERMKEFINDHAENVTRKLYEAEHGHRPSVHSVAVGDVEVNASILGGGCNCHGYDYNEYTFPTKLLWASAAELDAHTKEARVAREHREAAAKLKKEAEDRVRKEQEFERLKKELGK